MQYTFRASLIATKFRGYRAVVEHIYVDKQSPRRTGDKSKARPPPSTINKPRGMGSGAILGVTLILAGLPHRASAGLLDLYVGGAVGQGQVDTNSGGVVAEPTDHFRENHSAFKLMAGIHPTSLVGAEVEYVDFGHPNGSLGAAPANVTMRGPAAFGVLYLPVPIVDVFIKAGGARLQTAINGNAYESCPLNGIPNNCPPSVPFRVDRTNTSFAGGAGVQYKWGSFAVRAEYERFTTVGEHPRLLSIGAMWTFF